MITNAKLTDLERSWLEALLAEDFPSRDGIVQQINSADIIRDYTSGYLSMLFKVDKSEKPVKVEQRIPVEMEAFISGTTPILFLLHVIDGYVDELEIYNEGLAEINSELTLDGARLEVQHDRKESN